MTEIVGGFEKIDSSLHQIASGKYITGAVSLIGGIGKSLGGIFGWGTKDKKLEKKIAKHQRAIERLSEAYEKLKESMDDAWSMEDLKKYNDEMVKNIELQNANLRSMIAAEKDKKKTDSNKIHEYEKQLEENMKVLKEMKESLIEQLGGFGSEANYKAAAQASQTHGLTLSKKAAMHSTHSTRSLKSTFRTLSRSSSCSGWHRNT